MRRTALISKVLAIMLATTTVGYVFLANSVPFNISRSYTNNNKGALVLMPTNRVENLNGISKQSDNLIYFNSTMPFKFDTASVKVKFKNTSPQQQILLGYRDQNVWHYNTQVLDNPMLNNLNWPKTGNGPYLYQKTTDYKNVKDFLDNLPKNKNIGIVDYTGEDLQTSKINLPNYQPTSATTSINTPLRGKTTMFVYLNHEPFNMSFTKQDLNWAADPEAVKISVYKDKDKVFDATIDDDGNSTDNHKPGYKQTVNIKNPGPGLPESGVYKIVVDAPVDSLITKISTNLHKIVFEGPLYVADNASIYSAVAKTTPTKLVTNAQGISFSSEHNQSPTANIDNQLIKITKQSQVITANNSNPSANITIPNSDMILNGIGYFAFSADQFFEPTQYKILPIVNAEDLTKVDYVLTDYPGAPKHEGDWLLAERKYNLTDAATQKRQLSWLINAPELKQNNRTVEYKQIDMTLTKKGWFKQ
jgi:hypothetical protein